MALQSTSKNSFDGDPSTREHDWKSILHENHTSSFNSHSVMCCTAIYLAFHRSQLELEQTQIRVKGINAAISDCKQYLSKLPDSLKDVEKALMPLKK